MEDKQLAEIRKVVYGAMADILQTAAESAQPRANCVWVACECGETEHSPDAKYCTNCGRILAESR